MDILDNEFLLQDRLQKIQQIITRYGENNFYISFSGGKDSTVVHELVDMALPGNNIPRVYANTGIELNMIRDFVVNKTQKDDRFIILKPKVPIKQMLEKEGYPFKSKEHSHILEIYQRNGLNCVTVPRYLGSRDGYGNRFRCPHILEYQFTPDFKLNISDKCCKRLKEDILNNWAKLHNKTTSIIGLMRDEGGRRLTARCLSISGGKIKAFQPLVAITKEWEDWFVNMYNISICDIYKPPYNFERTGCKGCPFNPRLSDELHILEKYFPEERKQCELIWAPVYEEYRRIGYRLKE